MRWSAIVNCLTENTILQLVHHRLPPTERAVAEQHLDACPECLRAMAETAKYMFQDGSELVTLPQHNPSALIESGQQISRYIVEQPLGSGGMGVVYRAYDPQLDRRVALKLLHQIDRSDGLSQARLLREAQAMARLAHPNVVAVHDAGEHDGRVFVAMELIDGCTLAAWLAAEPRSWRMVVDAFTAAGQGLAAAHAAGLVHRDFKPQNVLMGSDGRVRVTDFGLARENFDQVIEAPSPRGSQRAIESMTHSGALAGTPAYMAPEQFAHKPADARTDQFSFCVAFYEALYGERPFAGETIVQIAEAVSAGVLPVRPRAKAVPEWLHTILVRGLSSAPEQRFPSLDMLLGEILHRHTRPRRRVGWIAASAVTVCAIIVGVAIYAYESPAPEPVANVPSSPAPAAAPAVAPTPSQPAGETASATSSPPTTAVVDGTPAAVASTASSPPNRTPPTKKRARPKSKRKVTTTPAAHEDAPLSPWGTHR